MRSLILAAAVIAMTFATSTAMADHFRHRHSYHHHSYHHRGPVVRHVVPYHAYRHVPVYAGRYAQPAHHHHGHHRYVYPGYARGGISINGPRLSLFIGF